VREKKGRAEKYVRSPFPSVWLAGILAFSGWTLADQNWIYKPKMHDSRATPPHVCLRLLRLFWRRPSHSNNESPKRATKATRIIITAAKISWQLPGLFHGHPPPFVLFLVCCFAGAQFFQFLVYATSNDKIGWAWPTGENEI